MSRIKTPSKKTPKSQFTGRKAYKRWSRTEAAVRYVNREASWLRFNRRVLDEAICPENPLLERLKFLAIFESNLDEFYMVRVSGLMEQAESGVTEASPDGLTPASQIKLITKMASQQRNLATKIFSDDLHPALAAQGVAIRQYGELTDKEKAHMRSYFTHEVFPLCTPLLLLPAPSAPFISNRSLNLLVEATDELGGMRLARVKIPTGIPRAVQISPKLLEFVLLEDVVRNNLDMLFPGVDIIGSHLFRVLRDADIEIRQLEAADLISTVEQSIRMRRFGDPVLLEANATMTEPSCEFLRQMLGLDTDDVRRVEGIQGFEVFQELSGLKRPDLLYPAHRPWLDEALADKGSLLDTIERNDVLVHHPYDSFLSVQSFFEAAAVRSDVVGVKSTLYRVGAESPIVESLRAAAEEGKQVTAMIELKARFDESNNLIWARALERAGVHVTYGFAEMKVHCKLALLVRRTGDGVKTLVHIGTGNYNPLTARIYTDVGLFSSRQDIAQDVSEMFNYLTGYSRQREFRRILVAPLNLREGILGRLKREIAAHRRTGEGRLIFKVNSLVDPEMVDALYEASMAGVQIDLIVRGICCLRPGVQGLSENIRVRSIVGRFLEHSRVYYFHNGGQSEALIGSADLMSRNLDRRIEVLAPISDMAQVKLLLNEVLSKYLQDNVKAWLMDSNGEYRRAAPGTAKPFNAQEELMARPVDRAIFPV